MILVTHFACCHQYKGYWRSCPLGWSYFTVMPGLNLRAGGAHAPEFTRLKQHIKVAISKSHVHIAMSAFENIFAILMFPDMHWMYIKKRKALHCKAFRIRNHPCSDKKVRNTGGVHSIRIFFFDRFGQYHSQERVTVQSFKKFLAKKRINALACSKILSNTST